MKWTRRFFGESSESRDEDKDDMVGRKEEARRVLASAQEGLAQAQQRQPEVSRVARSLREMRQRNHFAESIQKTFREST